MKKTLFLISISFAYCWSLDLSRFPKCSIYNATCQVEYIGIVARNVATTGVPELGIPRLEPFSVKHVTLIILGLLNMTITEGQAEGITSCRGLGYEMNVEERYKELAVICNITVRGRYKLTSVPALKESYADIHGHGNLTLTFEQWKFAVRYGIEIVEEADGRIYVKGLFDQDHTAYEASVGHLNVEINGIKKGKRDVSNSATCFSNKYWKAIMASDIGEFINYVSVEYLYDIHKKFFNYVPADQYLTDDLSELVDRRE